MYRVLLAVTLACGCWSGAAPVASEPAPPPKPAPKPRAPRPTVTLRLNLTEGMPFELPDGTVLDIKHVGYMHLADSKNVSTATLIVSQNGTTLDVGLANAHGSDVNKGVTKDAMGWRFTLEMADPYQQPSRAIVTAAKL